MLRHSHFISIIFFLLSCYPLQGQQQTYFNYSLAEGLPSATIFDIFQDKNGFIWFATDDGVVKYDGTTFETFRTKDGLSDPVVLKIYQDKQGRLWFKTHSGKLSYFEKNQIKLYKFNQALHELAADDIIHAIYVGDNDELLFSAGKVFGEINSTGQALIDKFDQHTFIIKTIKNNYLFGAFGVSTFIKTVNIDNQLFKITLSDTLNHNKAYCVINWQKHLYFSINNNIFKYDGKSVTKVYTGISSIISLSLDNKDQIWVGFKGNGVERFNDDKFQNPYPLDIVGKYSVTKVIQDHERGVWVSTLEKGIYYLPIYQLKITCFPLI